MSGFVTSWRSRAANLSFDPWTFERFGLTPAKLVRRTDRGAPKVLSVSLPKAGTHLLERALCLHPRLHRKLLATVWPEALARWDGLGGLLGTLSPGQVVVAHLPFDPSYPEVIDATQTRSLFLTRDPRDVVVSQAHYAVSRPNHPFHRAFAEQTDLRGRILVAIEGDADTGLPSIAARLDNYEGWLHEAFVVRFEDLVGPSGGGGAERQRDVLRRLYLHLELGDDPDLIDRIAARLFSDASPTFRRGAIGGWRARFDDELMDRFSAAMGDRLVRYGYAP